VEPTVKNGTSSSPGHRGRAIGVVSIMTVIVAGFGYFREAALAARFGLSTSMDAYFAAIFIPTMVYMTLIAGTLSPVFIPILLQEEASGEPGRLSETFSVVTTFTLILLCGIVICALVTARQWLALLFPGFSAQTAAATRGLVFIIFPSVIFVALAGILTATLNGFHKFALASFAPALSSVAVIAAVFLAHGEKALYTVGIATAVGFALQFLLLVPAAAALGIRYRPVLNLHHPAIGKLFRLGGPLLAYLITANASSFVERNLASQLSVGAVSTLTYAMRLFTVPSNFLAAPLGIVLYPQFAREALREGRGDLSGQVSRIFRAVLFVFLPVMVWTMVNALPVTRLLFERGQFHLENSIITSQVLRLYSIGILPLALGGILLRCFYAVQDTVTALVAEVIDLVFYVLAAPFLSRHFGIGGLAFTRGISFYLVCGILVFVLWKRKRLLKVDADLLRFVALTTIASLVMGALSWITLHVFRFVFDSGGTSLRLAVVAMLLLISGAAFLGMARLLKLREATHILETVLAIATGSRNRNPEVAGVVVGK
jgi:putative peptidoglycan lipid II flippase